jgi:hypothetical protein
MSRRTAVLCIWLITAATAVAAIILPHAPNTFAAVLIFIQTLLILATVMLLEQHPLPVDREDAAPADSRAAVVQDAGLTNVSPVQPAAMTARQ